MCRYAGWEMCGGLGGRTRWIVAGLGRMDKVEREYLGVEKNLGANQQCIEG